MKSNVRLVKVAIFCSVLMACSSSPPECSDYTFNSISSKYGLNTSRELCNRKQVSLYSAANDIDIRTGAELSGQYWHMRHCHTEEFGEIDSMLHYRVSAEDTTLHAVYDRYKIVYACDARGESRKEYASFLESLLTNSTGTQLLHIDQIIYDSLVQHGDFIAPDYDRDAMALALAVNAVANSSVDTATQRIVIRDIRAALESAEAKQAVRSKFDDLVASAVGGPER